MLNDTLSLSGVNAGRGLGAAGPQPPGHVSKSGEEEPAGLATEFETFFAQTSSDIGAAATPADHERVTRPAGDVDAPFKAAEFPGAAPPGSSAESAATALLRPPPQEPAQATISLQSDIGDRAALVSAADLTPKAEEEPRTPPALFAPRAIAEDGASAASAPAPLKAAAAIDKGDVGDAEKKRIKTDVGNRRARDEASIPTDSSKRTSPDAEPAIAPISGPLPSREGAFATALPGQPAIAGVGDAPPVNSLTTPSASHAPDLPASVIATSLAQSSSPALAPPDSAHSGDAAPAFRIALVIKSDDRDFELRLDPPDLGSVTLSFVEDEGGVQRAFVTADSRETLDLLRRHADVLQRELLRAGAGDFQLDFFDRREGDRSYDGRSASRKIRFGATPEAFVAAAGSGTILTASGHIDRFA